MNIMVKHGEPILVNLRSANKIESGTATNAYTVYFPKPNTRTNKYLLKFNGLQMDSLATLITNARTIDVRVNFPSESFDTLSGGQCNTIGFANFNGNPTPSAVIADNANIKQTFISNLPLEKVVYINGGNYSVGLYNMSNVLVTDNATSVLPNHIISFSLTPIYED